MVVVRSDAIDTLMAGGIEAFELRQQRLDVVDGLDHIGAGHAQDGENDGALLVVPAGQQVVLRRLDRLSDVANSHRRAVAIGDDQIVIGFRLQQLVVGIEGEGLPRAVERSLWQVDIGTAEHGSHILQAEAAGGERLRIDLNPDRRLLLAADADLADAGYLRDLRQQNVFRIGVDGRQRQRLGSQGEQDDRRIRRVHLPDRRRIRHIGRQIGARGVDRGQHIHRGAVDRAAELELRRSTGRKPSALDEVNWVRPGIWLNCCSSGVATEDAMVCGSAPGNWALI